MDRVYRFSKRANGTYRFMFSSYLGLICVFGYVFFYRPLLKRILASVRFVNYYIPKAWAVGAHCCDHGGRLMSWHFCFTWNDGQVYRHDIGDGPDTWCRMSLYDFLSRRVNGIYSERA